MSYTIAAFYRFVSITDPAMLQRELIASFSGDELCGTLLIATEGVNGTLAGSAATIDRLLETLAAKVGLDRNEVKFAASDERPFGRLKFKVRDEIIPFRKAAVDPTNAGTYVQPEEWNALIADPEVLLLGHPQSLRSGDGHVCQLSRSGHRDLFRLRQLRPRASRPGHTQKGSMFCTGGIRCEKASAFMLQEGFSEVYHLKGGILKYLEEVPEQSSKWRGDCFVFDRRRGVAQRRF